LRAKRDDSVLLIVDMQDKIIDTVADKESLLHCSEAIVKASSLLNVPSILTQQEKLGNITPRIIRSYASDREAIKKLTFSCCGVSNFRDNLQKLGRKTIFAIGVETHVCVLQTVLDLLAFGYNVLVLRDATSSFRKVDRRTAIERMRDDGAWITTTESAIFELTEDAERLEFKQILEIIKTLRHNLTHA